MVVGILIALQINNWNGNRKQNAIKQNYYRQLLLDLETDKIYCNSSISTLNSFLSEYNHYLEIYKVPGLNVSKAFEGLSKLNYTRLNLEFKTATIKTLISTGDIKLISPSLRNQLTAFVASQIHVANRSKTLNDFGGSILSTVVIKGGNPDLLMRLQNQPELRKTFGIEQNLPTITLRLEGFYFSREYGAKASINGLSDLSEEADAIIELINKELEY